MSYYGDIRLGDTIDIKFTTRQISGAPSTLSSSPVISAYPSNSTTQLTAGITLSVDFDSVTGLNNVRVVASGGNGYLTATNYELVITTGTVNSVSVVGECIGGFSIENRSALMPATAARTLVVDAAGLADANAVKVGPTGSGTAQTAGDIKATLGTPAGASLAADLAEIEAETDGIAAIPTSTPLTAAQIATGVWQDATAGDFTAANSIGKSVMNGVALGTGLTINAYTGNTPQTGDSYARLGAPAGASVSADITTVINGNGVIYSAVLAAPAAIWTDTTAADFTVANSIGKSIMNGISLGTGLTIAAVSGAVGSVTAGVTLTSGERNSVADAFLARNIAGGSSSGRIVTDALRFLRNKWSVSGTTLTVTQEDDSTSAWTATISTDAAALPIIGTDPT